MIQKQIRAAVEAMLFAYAEPIGADKLAQALQLPTASVESALEALHERCQKEDSGLCLLHLNSHWQLATKSEFAECIRRVLDTRRSIPLGPAAMETLTVIAYNQPVTREVVKGIRGVNSDGVIASLVDKGLVRELGRDPERGQAIIYGTTNAFLEKFGLRSTRDLPDLEQFAPDEQSRQFIRERLSGRSIQSTLEEQAEDLDEERELIDTDVEDADDAELLPTGDTSEDMHDED